MSLTLLHPCNAILHRCLCSIFYFVDLFYNVIFCEENISSGGWKKSRLGCSGTHVLLYGFIGRPSPVRSNGYSLVSFNDFDSCANSSTRTKISLCDAGQIREQILESRRCQLSVLDSSVRTKIVLDPRSCNGRQPVFSSLQLKTCARRVR